MLSTQLVFRNFQAIHQTAILIKPGVTVREQLLQLVNDRQTIIQDCLQ